MRRRVIFYRGDQILLAGRLYKIHHSLQKTARSIGVSEFHAEKLVGIYLFEEKMSRPFVAKMLKKFRGEKNESGGSRIER